MMKLHPPIMITSRLMAGIKVNDGTISISYSENQDQPNGRIRFKYAIDLPNFSYENEELIGRGNLQSALGDLLVFLQSAGESYYYDKKLDPDCDMFPDKIQLWAGENYDGLSMMNCEIDPEETDKVLIEE